MIEWEEVLDIGDRQIESQTSQLMVEKRRSGGEQSSIGDRKKGRKSEWVSSN